MDSKYTDYLDTTIKDDLKPVKYNKKWCYYSYS
jgi:hypothetical protein